MIPRGQQLTMPLVATERSVLVKHYFNERNAAYARQSGGGVGRSAQYWWVKHSCVFVINEQVTAA